ncbi:Glyoxalase/Bleomycin resistance protein/Dihydroxybiphenyl dioxygenase [Macroventuria anomochaeta]|uniref:Glyoxalase/Bleomycin resistance protein/Dihydroxybiphenyl dioxygenase n=1 Tax=Macroventuria anomochaeta TaxID=301207 RepID=A0ACB6SER2_9PLEO|nr:Glyoxalase/Bleomycin resistance protein/Dihydroxybiphenyl dioxygenase [Macroventuria anomochaeta]KAF2631799.1 Glyoxalase/Bleomycin resistance protein/Dihydroxybiphenyl dioxygenase [Macroventuria anomochaeta]
MMSTSPAADAAAVPTLQAHLRIARPTRSISALLPFYTTGLGFQTIGSFRQHAGFNGVMLGHPSLPYHLEFTEQEGHDPGQAPTQENLLVFYLPKKEEWDAAVRRMKSTGVEPVKSYNPYWDVDGKGKTHEDADGYRVVLWNGGWSPS